jgi:hypothetical protein
MPVQRVHLGCTPHKVMYLPGSSSPKLSLYAVVVSTEVEVDMEEEKAMELAKADENGEEYDQIGSRWGAMEEPGQCALVTGVVPGVDVVVALCGLPPLALELYISPNGVHDSLSGSVRRMLVSPLLGGAVTVDCTCLFIPRWSGP